MAFLQDIWGQTKKYGFWHIFNANFTNLTCSSWICNQEWSSLNWPRCLIKDTFILKPTMWSHLALSYPCSDTCWKYTFLQYTNLVASSNSNLQLTNFNWAERLSLAQLCPTLFSNPHVELELFTKFLQNFDNSIFIQSAEQSWSCGFPFYSSHMKDGLFISLNPMDHNWNLIPPIVDLLDGYFEIILLPFLGHWTQDLSAPGAAIFPEFNPYILYQEFWLSNEILNHVVCFIGNIPKCWHTPSCLLQTPF